jgi:hypothetical protein
MIDRDQGEGVRGKKKAGKETRLQLRSIDSKHEIHKEMENASFSKLCWDNNLHQWQPLRHWRSSFKSTYLSRWGRPMLRRYTLLGDDGR